MSFSTSRLTLYVVLSAIEDDLRETIELYLHPQVALPQLLNEELYTKLTRRADADDAVVNGEQALSVLLVYADFGDLHQLLNTFHHLLPLEIREHIRTHTPLLEKLIPIRNRVAHARPLHFDDLAVVIDGARELTHAADVAWDTLRATLHRLDTEPSFVLGITIPSYDSDADRQHNLPTPDFDETGFVGRKQQVAQLTKLCRGQWPVITIVGDGGVGKTALALKVAYDVLDAPDCPFEAVVWTSSKTAHLTAHEIVRIRGAISDSIGVIGAVAEQLGGTSTLDPVEEVLEYLRAFRILLILDNLETVLDDRIRSFLERLPDGSKLLITSRIGLGAFEYPHKLQPMSDSESIQLMRALAKTRQADDLVKAPNATVAGYCSRMHNNPGFIKWFVAAVQAGRRPEEVLQNPDLFLEFCMSNVYEYLFDDSREVLRAMVCVPGGHSQAQLAFLTQLEVLPLQRSLQQLLTTNMIVMSSTPRGSSFESQYDVSELARAYLIKHHPVPSQASSTFIGRKNELSRAGEQLTQDQDRNPFSGFSISVKSKSDLIVAKYLHDALAAAHRNDYVRADELVARARGLAPEFFEVHRVEGWVKSRQGNIPAAHAAYEAAIELEPRSSPLRFFYGGFLLRHGDLGESVTQFKHALELAPGTATVEVELARAALYAGQFPAARSAIDALLTRGDIGEWLSRKAYDLHLQYFSRLAAVYVGRHDNGAALNELRKLKDAYHACPTTLLDARMRMGLGHAVVHAQACAKHIADPASRQEAKELARWLLEQASGEVRELAEVDAAARRSGRVVRINVAKNYANVLAEDGKEFAATRSSLRDPKEWDRLQAGALVKFRASWGRKGLRAVDITISNERHEG